MAVYPPWTPEMDKQAVDFGDRLRAKYRGDVDVLGWMRWGSDWRQVRANGYTHDEAWYYVRDSIDAVRADQPVPTMPPGPYAAPWPPELDAVAETFADLLTKLYASDKNFAPGPVDALGWVRWSSDYRIARAAGLSHKSAWSKVEREILSIWGTLPIGPHPDPIVGQLGIGDSQWRDANGPRIPVFCHAGDLIGQALVFGLDRVLPVLDQIAAVGYHGLRSWINVEAPDGSPAARFWSSKPAPRWSIDGRTAGAVEIFRAGAERGLKWHVSSGGFEGLSRTKQRRLFSALADCIDAVGAEHFALVGAVNEGRDTTNGNDAEPDHLASLVKIVSDRHPSILTKLTAYTGTEDRVVIERYTPASQRFTYIHGYRGGRANDKIRHIFSWTYEDALRNVGWQGEPFGVGRLVSAIDGSNELDAGVMQLAAAMAAISRQVWTFMSGPGVILFDEPFDSMPGFSETPAFLKRLPQDVASWPIHGHSGKSQRGRRIHTADEEYEGNWRADYSIAVDGRFVEVSYGPREDRNGYLGRRQQERGTRDVVRLVDCAWGWVETGRLL